MTCESNSLLDCCLFFTANSLGRVISRMGEEEFSRIGMTPSSAFLLMLVMESPRTMQKELADKLHLAPATVSRLVDSMVRSDLVSKEGQGRNTYISPTAAGKAMAPKIHQAWESLYNRYCAILGKEEAIKLTQLTREACAKLEES